MDIVSSLLVLLGGFLGGAARFLVSAAVDRRAAASFPCGTLAVNVSGAACVGALAGLAIGAGGFAHAWFRAFFVVGFCGGYTTVSTFCLQTLVLLQDGARSAAALNIAMSAGLSVLAAAAGLLAATALAG